MRPIALTWSAILTSAALLRSPTTVPAELDATSANVAARSADRGVQNHLVAVANKRLRRRAAQPVHAAGDEDECHQLLLRLSI
jgi:hypothetical protein